MPLRRRLSTTLHRIATRLHREPEPEPKPDGTVTHEVQHEVDHHHHVDPFGEVAADVRRDFEASFNAMHKVPWMRRSGRRSDASTQPSGVVSARLGIGGESQADPTADMAPPVAVVDLADEHIDALMSRGLPHRLMTHPVERCLAPGWRVQRGDDRDVSAELDARLGLPAVLSEAMVLARADRAAFVLLVTSDVGDVSDLAEPMPEGATVERLHVLGRRELDPRTWDEDLTSEHYGMPATYTVTTDRPLVQLSGVIHASRLVRIDGAAHLPYLGAVDPDGYGPGMMDLYWGAIRDRALASGYTARIVVQKGRVWVRFAATAGRAARAAQGPATVRQRLQTWLRSWGGNGVGILSEGDEVGRDDIALSGIGDVMTSMWMDVATVEGQSLTSLTGQAPSGLSTDDAAGRRASHALWDSLRTRMAMPILTRVYDLAFGAGEWGTVEWEPYDTPTAEERAARSSTLAQRDQVLIDLGVITPEQSRARILAEGGEALLPVFEVATEADAPDPVMVEAMRETLASMAPTAPADRADAETYQPPESARNNARRVLRWREEHGDEVAGMTRVGWTRARQLASGEPVSRETVGRMAAFARHRKNAEVAPEHEGTPWRDAGHVAWLGWGGTTGIEWAADIVDRDD